MEIETITLAAHEAQCERLARIVRWMAVGWALSMLIMGLAIMMLASYEEEVVTTETTTSEISQDSDDYGTNIYAGGDMTYGYADSQDEYGQDDNDGSPTRGGSGD